MPESAYQPFEPVRRPGGKPKSKPTYRILVHRQYARLWAELPQRLGLESAQQFYDYVAFSPGTVSPINRTTILAGKAGRPWADGFSRTVHYEISGAGRINYQYNDAYTEGAIGDAHRVVVILTIELASH
jgi:hypothetical protein